MKPVAFITGGVGDIGQAICRHFIKEGYRVLYTYHNKRPDAYFYKEIHREGHYGFQLDVTDSEAILALSHELEAEITQLDVLVNCAGFTTYVDHTQLYDLTDNLFDKIMQVNVRAPFAMVRGFESLLKKGQGTVINLTSIAAKTAMGSNIAYCASKAALENMTKSLARAMAPDIKVIAVAPGLVHTKFIENFDQSFVNEQINKTPLKRLVTVEEVAQAVFSAVHHFFSTGCTLAVDGGRPIAP